MGKPQPKSSTLGRRKFIVATAVAGGGLMLGFRLPVVAQIDVENGDGIKPSGSVFEDIEFNAWIRVSTDDSVTILVSQSEMGQGVFTSLPMLVAEELGADWEIIKVEQAPASRAYVNSLIEREFLGAPITETPDGRLASIWAAIAGSLATRLGKQFTGGSASIRFWAQPLREAGAAVREMLVAAAATQWQVSPAECEVDKGIVYHPSTDRSLGFGAVARAASKLAVPKHPVLKNPDEFTMLGKPVPRLDIPMKVDGSAEFGIDVMLSGMLYAAPRTSPVFGGEVKSYSSNSVMGLPGVTAVLPVPHGVVVVADSTWRAQKASQALEIEFNNGENSNASSGSILANLLAAETNEDGVVDHANGDVEAAFAESSQVIEAEYSVPYLAHACMEPINCTASVSSMSCEVWIPTQAQHQVQIAAAEAAGVSEDDVTVNTTFLGGGFGRRGETDMVTQAVLASRAVGRPVKITWSREEDTRNDFYRPMAYGRLRAALDSNGNVTGWRHRIASPSILKRRASFATFSGHDITSVEGAANLPYQIPNQLIEYVMTETPVPVGFWRSVGSSQNAFITESFVDELAHAALQDPYTYRRELLVGKPRFQKVLDLAAEKAGWGTDMPAGWGRGIAIHKCFGSIAAQVAEVQISATGDIRVRRVICAIDCGQVINPDTVIAQMEGGIIYGLTAALFGEINIENGRATNGNFDTYKMLRMADCPVIETYFLEGGLPLGGVGEPGTPPIAPAVTNAIYAATGKRVRELPIRNHDLSF